MSFSLNSKGGSKTLSAALAVNFVAFSIALLGGAVALSAQSERVDKRYQRLNVEMVEVFQMYVGDAEPGMYVDPFTFEPPVDDMGELIVAGAEKYVDPDGFIRQRPIDKNGDPVEGLVIFAPHGGEFITHGILYPKGTIDCDEFFCNGVDENGNPEFPEKVIGTWTCKGWLVGQGAFAGSGAWTATSQIYSFTADPEIKKAQASGEFNLQFFDYSNEYGQRTITTDGFESPASRRVQRSITGGTGIYGGVRGIQGQKLIGFNPTGGIVLEVDFRFARFWWF